MSYDTSSQPSASAPLTHSGLDRRTLLKASARSVPVIALAAAAPHAAASTTGEVALRFAKFGNPGTSAMFIGFGDASGERVPTQGDVFIVRVDGLPEGTAISQSDELYGGLILSESPPVVGASGSVTLTLTQDAPEYFPSAGLTIQLELNPRPTGAWLSATAVSMPDGLIANPSTVTLPGPF